jgi:hypothetical protein
MSVQYLREFCRLYKIKRWPAFQKGAKEKRKEIPQETPKDTKKPKTTNKKKEKSIEKVLFESLMDVDLELELNSPGVTSQIEDWLAENDSGQMYK